MDTSNKSNKPRGIGPKWTYKQRVLAANGLVEGLDQSKSKSQIKRRLAKNEGDKLAQVKKVRDLWRSGMSARAIERMMGFDCRSWIFNKVFIDPTYDHRNRIKD